MKPILVLLASAGLLLLNSLSQSLAAERPNFLFIYTDDQRWDAMSVVQREQGDKGRFPWLKTPNLDRIAAEGVRFRNAFVVNSLCAPSRATFVTGQYGHVNGIVNNHTQFPTNNVSHATLLRKTGYATGYVGKWHMDGQVERPGFDFSASFTGQGRYFDCPVYVNGMQTPTQGWVDDVSTDYAVKFMRENKEKPFVLVVGYKAAHGPFEPPERRKNDYAGEAARAVPNLRSRAIYLAEGQGRGMDLAAETVPVNLNYFRCLTAMDDNVGRLLQTLDELKLADNTMVVFAGDNGFYLGEHGLGDKRSAYEESLRIPLLLRFPKSGVKGRLVNQLTLNVDLAPTFVDYAGLAAPKEMHGRSWRPLLEGQAADWRKAFFYCYFFERGFRVPTVTAVRTDTAKLIKYPGHPEWTEVFDLARDPYELKNIFADPAAASLRAELETEYDRQAKAIAFRIPDFADEATQESASHQPLKGWVLDYRFDQDTADKVVDASGQKNHGKARDAALVDGRDGRKARRFDGSGFIEVPKSPSLDPSVGAWAVEATFKADKPDGIVLTRGGASIGYCLYVKAGKPAFAVVSQNQTSRVTADAVVTGKWTRATARITAAGELVLALDGQTVARAKLRAAIAKDPHDTMQIGADTGSRVLADENLPMFTGLIESVRLYSGEAP